MKKNSKNNNKKQTFNSYKKYKKHYFSNDAGESRADDTLKSPYQFGRKLAEESLSLIRKNLK